MGCCPPFTSHRSVVEEAWKSWSSEAFAAVSSKGRGMFLAKSPFLRQGPPINLEPDIREFGDPFKRKMVFQEPPPLSGSLQNWWAIPCPEIGRSPPHVGEGANEGESIKRRPVSCIIVVRLFAGVLMPKINCPNKVTMFLRPAFFGWWGSLTVKSYPLIPRPLEIWAGPAEQFAVNLHGQHMFKPGRGTASAI